LAINEEVHHIDRNKANNKPDNLQAVNHIEHMKLHRGNIREW
jgi:hypothetical protein